MFLAQEKQGGTQQDSRQRGVEQLGSSLGS
jgi:hypothetical protein